MSSIDKGHSATLLFVCCGLPIFCDAKFINQAGKSVVDGVADAFQVVVNSTQVSVHIFLILFTGSLYLGSACCLLVATSLAATDDY